jgi:glutamate/aspartate transport system permease protein
MNDLDPMVVVRALPWLAEGLRYTLTLTLVAAAGGLALGTLLALARLSSGRVLSRLAGAYVNLMRSLPLLLVLFWFYFLVPYALQAITGAENPPRVGAERSAYVTFILFEAAYFCEIVRAGIASVGAGQSAAATALGLTRSQALTQVILPQAFRNMLPVLLTQGIILFQDVSLVSLLNVTDFVGAAGKIAQRDGRVVEMTLCVALVYLVLCTTASTLVRRWQRSHSIGRRPEDT